MVEEYDEDSLFCSECTDDWALKAKIQKDGIKGVCSVCDNDAEHVATFDTLAGWLETVWREWFQVGTYVPVVQPDSDNVEYEQRGDDAQLLIGELIQCRGEEEKVVSSLIYLMSRGDHYEVKQGTDPLIAECQQYQQRRIKQSLVDGRWNHFVRDLKHHTRFFNSKAIDFLNTLFEHLKDVHTRNMPPHPPFRKFESNPVVQKYEPGSLAIFRARKVDGQDTLEKILASPETELGNPPDRLAAEGRMNPKGISFFYGAEDRQTCVAELRPSLSEKAISGEFELIESVQLLDMTLLSRGHHPTKLIVCSTRITRLNEFIDGYLVNYTK